MVIASVTAPLLRDTNLERMPIFVNAGLAAMRRGEVVLFATRFALAVLDRAGSGRVPMQQAREFLVAWRGITPGTARRILREAQEAGYMRQGRTRNGANCLFLTGIGRLMVNLGVNQERPQRSVPLAALRTVAGMRAELGAGVLELPGHSGRLRNAPLSRALRERLTGISKTSQQRHDRVTTTLIQPMFAEVEHTDPVRLVGGGYFIGKGGRQIRRLPDIRTPNHQWASGRSATRHALRKARQRRERLGGGVVVEPVFTLRGQNDPAPPPDQYERTFFVAASEAAAQAEAAKQRNHSGGPVVIAWGRTGALRARIIESRR